MNVCSDFDAISGIGDLKEIITAILTFVRIIAGLILMICGIGDQL